MKADNECWRLAKDCAQWAAETHDPGVRSAFLAMAKEFSRLGLQETADGEPTDGRCPPQSATDALIQEISRSSIVQNS